jgi:hypothetical protein
MQRIVFVLMLIAFSGSLGWSGQGFSAQGLQSTLRANEVVTIKGFLSGPVFDANLEGPCTGAIAGFSDKCANGHSCQCQEIQNATFSSTIIGRGTANVFITVDVSAGFGLSINPAPPTPILPCFPIVAEIDISAKNDNEVLETVGDECTSISTGFGELNGIFTGAVSNLFSTEVANFSANRLIVGTNEPVKITFTGSAMTK